MRRLGTIVFVLGIALAPSAVAGAGFDGKSQLICAATDAIECRAGGACIEGRAELVNFPPLLRIDFKKKRVFAMDVGGEEVTSFEHVANKNGALILHGLEGVRGWSLTITHETGRMSVAVSGHDDAFLVFGACAPSP